jgi:hypothetical protein
MSGADIFSLVVALLCAFTAGWYFAQKDYPWTVIEIFLMALNLMFVFT